MKKLMLIVCAIVLLAAGCQEEQRNPNYKPLNELITPARQDWKDAYGDTLQTQMMFNLAVLRFNDIEIAKAIRGNQVAMNIRIDNLEPDPNEPDMEKIPIPPPETWIQDSLRFHRLKINETIDWINKQ